MISALEFYEKNKNCTWRLDPIPLRFSSNIEKARWILNTANIGWLELDLAIDISKWQHETNSARYYKHRGKDHPGWNSSCIHGIDVDKTGAWTTYGYSNEVEVPYCWTEISKSTPVIKDFWSNTFPADNYRRIRFMKLESNGIISPHSDMPGKLPGEEGIDMLEFGVPISIAVIHPEDCYMTIEGFGVVPFKEGKVFIVNIRHYHSVINFSKNDRIHIIGHSYGYGTGIANFADLIVRSYNKMENAQI
jgi:hypothetical protein